MLSSEPRALVHASLSRAPRERIVMEMVRVVMLKDGDGMTSHGRRPIEIHPKAGDVLEVSGDLAENWGGAGYCKPYKEPVASVESLPVVPVVPEDTGQDVVTEAMVVESIKRPTKRGRRARK